jgi:hypothetical protein
MSFLYVGTRPPQRHHRPLSISTFIMVRCLHRFPLPSNIFPLISRRPALLQCARHDDVRVG